MLRLQVFVTILAILSLSGHTFASSVEDELKMSAKDEVGNETKALKAELLISRNDEKALQQLKKLLSKYKGTALEASLHFRLAELYMRKAKTATFFEVHRKDDEVVNFAPKQVKSEGSRQWVTKSVDTYDFIQKKFSHFRDMDLVLFNNAFARQILGQEKAAVQLYKKVIDNFTDSPLVPDSHLAVGEVLYNSKSFEAAYAEFQKIRQYSDSRVYAYGLYKGAWALYNLRRNEEAMKQLEEVVDFSFAQASEEEGSNKLVLVREALEDMVSFYEDVKKPQDAVSYFKKQSRGQQYGSLILKLGSLYQRHGKHQFLETVYTDLISDSPLIVERPQIHKELVESYEIRQKRGNAVEELEKLSQLCTEGSKWFGAQEAPARKECLDELFETGKLHAAKWHKEYNKSKAVVLGNFVRRAYESILREFKYTDIDKVRYSYSELLFQLNDFRKASEQYSLVAAITKDSKMKHDASYAALVSLEKDVKEKWSDKDEELFSNLAATYIKMNPQGSFVTDVKFKKAFIAYEKGKYDRATPELRELAIAHSGTERGKKAATIYLDILNLKKNFALLKDESLFFIKKLSFDKNTKQEFLKIHQQAYLIVIQELESSKKYAEASAGYKSFADDNPESELADKALYNAIRCATLAEKPKDAAALSEYALKKYSHSPYNLEITKNLVQIYESFAQLGSAANTLLKLAELDSKNKQENLLRAADYKALSGDWKPAYQIYAQLGGSSSLERMAALQEKYGEWKNTEKLLNQIIASQVQPQASIASYKITKKYCDEKNDEECFKLSKQVVSQRNEKNVSKWAVAQARMQQARILEKEFDQVGVKARPERLSQVLAIKADKLERVQKAYQDVLNLGDKQTAIEALARLAGVYNKFSQGLRGIEAPADLPENDKTKFNQEIENMVIPMEEKGAETLQIALKQAKQLDLHDGLIAQIQDELNKLSRKNAKAKLQANISKPENYLPTDSAKAQDCSKLVEKAKSSWSESVGLKAASSCFAAQDFGKVEAVAVLFSESDTKSPWGPYFHALLAKDKGDYERAQWMLALAQARDSKSAAIMYLQGQVYWYQKNFKKAVEFFEKSLDVKPSIFPALLTLAQVYYEDAEYSKAAEKFKDALSYDSKNELALYGLAESELRNKNHQEAISSYERLASLYGADGTYLLRVAEIYENDLHNSQEAFNAYSNLKKKIKSGKVTKNIDPNLDMKIKQLERKTASTEGAKG